MQHEGHNVYYKLVVISFQFSTFVSLMQLKYFALPLYCVVISFQFSTFVSLMQPCLTETKRRSSL